MGTQRQLTFLGPRKLEWREVPLPTLETDKDALVRPLAVARCDLDLYMAIGLFPARPPFAFGHEMTALVTDVGGDVQNVRPGDRVIVPFQISCGECLHCRRGWTSACTAVPRYAAYGLGVHPEDDPGGGFSDSVRVPFADAMLVPLPEGISPEAGCGLGDCVAEGYRAVAPHLSSFPGEDVLVVGGLGQAVGLYTVMAARALGAGRVTYTDFDEGRLALARSAGADAVRVDYGATKRADRAHLITVDASGSPDGFSFAIRSTAACGFCTAFSGGLTPTIELPLRAAYMRGITLNVSRVNSRTVLPELLECVHAGTIDPLAPVMRHATFDEAVDAMLDPCARVVFSRD